LLERRVEMGANLLSRKEKLVCLVRHGDAKSKEEDPDRPLTDGGRDAARRIAEWAAAAGVKPDQIRHSGKLRAQQTAEIFGESLRPPDGTISADGLGPNDDVEAMAESLLSEDRTIMLVGHLPFLARLASQLIVGKPDRTVVQFDAAALVTIGQRKEQWSVICAIQPGLVP
jgi:phosphohistidine phosphatase